MQGIRTAAKAIVIRDGRLLLTHCRDDSGDWYALPGGGQQPGETLCDALVRECREEIGAEVVVERLLFVRDYIAANHDFSYLEEASHQVEHLFECRVPDDYEAGNGPHPDSHQVGVVWLGHAELRRARVYPSRLHQLVDPSAARPIPVYWGDEN